MGYYIEVPNKKGKAQQLVDLYGARVLNEKPSFGEVAPDKAIICVLDNGSFEAAGYAFNEQELGEFAFPDGRPRIWLLMDLVTVRRLTGYTEEY